MRCDCPEPGCASRSSMGRHLSGRSGHFALALLAFACGEVSSPPSAGSPRARPRAAIPRLTLVPCARILCSVNLTISVDDSLLEKARRLARRRGISLQELLRAQLEVLVGRASGDAVADELLELMKTHGGRSGARRIQREEAYEDMR